MKPKKYPVHLITGTPMPDGGIFADTEDEIVNWTAKQLYRHMKQAAVDGLPKAMNLAYVEQALESGSDTLVIELLPDNQICMHLNSVIRADLVQPGDELVH